MIKDLFKKHSETAQPQPSQDSQTVIDEEAAASVAAVGASPPTLLTELVRELKKTKNDDPQSALGSMLGSQSKQLPQSQLSERYGTLSSTLGKGSFGVVKMAQKMDPTNKAKKLVYAVKEYHPPAGEPAAKFVKRLAAEFCLASSLNHPNIIKTLDLLQEGKSKFFGVMEFCAGGDLYSLIVVAGRLEYIESDCFFKQILRGVAYMHEMGVAHRDLKPENVLLTACGVCKLTDFGNAECFRMAWEDDVHYSRTLAGSGPYIAPEEYKKNKFDPRAVDVWAAGVVYMAMVSGRHLWQEARSGDEFYEKYLVGRKDENGYDAIERLKTDKRKNVVYSVLDPVPTRRLTAKQALNSEWVREIVVCCDVREDKDCHDLERMPKNTSIQLRLMIYDSKWHLVVNVYVR